MGVSDFVASMMFGFNKGKEPEFKEPIEEDKQNEIWPNRHSAEELENLKNPNVHRGSKIWNKEEEDQKHYRQYAEWEDQIYNPAIMATPEEHRIDQALKEWGNYLEEERKSDEEQISKLKDFTSELEKEFAPTKMYDSIEEAKKDKEFTSTDTTTWREMYEKKDRIRLKENRAEYLNCVNYDKKEQEKLIPTIKENDRLKYKFPTYKRLLQLIKRTDRTSKFLSDEKLFQIIKPWE